MNRFAPQKYVSFLNKVEDGFKWKESLFRSHHARHHPDPTLLSHDDARNTDAPDDEIDLDVDEDVEFALQCVDARVLGAVSISLAFSTDTIGIRSCILAAHGIGTIQGAPHMNPSVAALYVSNAYECLVRHKKWPMVWWAPLAVCLTLCREHTHPYHWSYKVFAFLGAAWDIFVAYYAAS